ncbi:MAG TPA: hypothetical protein VN418_06160 [Gammaproteobacteria bacterium]|nr:hypothetical protein [Gammaproteobacteria bacterium]
MTRLFYLISILAFGLLVSGCTTTPALHVIGIYEARAKEVVVNITDDTRPVVLALTAYDKTLWKVNLKDGVKLKRIILAGYHSQHVTGLPPNTPIEVYTYDPSPCELCWQGPYIIHYSSYQEPSVELRKITGLDVTSYQWLYQGVEFSIFPGMKKWIEQKDKVSTQHNPLRRSAAGIPMACGCPEGTPIGKCKCAVNSQEACSCVVEQ